METIYDDDLESDVEPGQCEVLEAAFLGMPMGWSRALYFCHACLQQAMRSALRAEGLPDTLVGDRHPPPLAAVGGDIAMPYADNGNIICATMEAGVRHYNVLVGSLESPGFALRDHVWVEDCAEFLGFSFDGNRRVLSHTSRRCGRLFWSLAEVIRRGWVSGPMLRIINGHLCHHFGLVTGGISILQSVFSLVQELDNQWAWLSAEVAGELWTAKTLVFCQQDLGRRCYEKVFCGDSSALGYALHETWSTLGEVLSLGCWRVRWRFAQARKRETHRTPGALAGVAADCPWLSGGEEFDQEFGEDDCRDELLAPQPRGRPAPKARREFHEVNGVVPALPENLLDEKRWRRVVAGAWRRPA